MKKLILPLVLCALFGLGISAVQAQRGGDRGPLPLHEAPTAAGIAWFGDWNNALAEAKRTGRPILFMSAAPQCRNVPGVW